VTFWYGSGYGLGSWFCSFCQWPSRCQKGFFAYCLLNYSQRDPWSTKKYGTIKPATDAIFELWTVLQFYLIMACLFFIHVKLFFTIQNLYPYIFYYSVNFAFPCNIPSKVQNSSVIFYIHNFKKMLIINLNVIPAPISKKLRWKSKDFFVSLFKTLKNNIIEFSLSIFLYRIIRISCLNKFSKYVDFNPRNVRRK